MSVFMRLAELTISQVAPSGWYRGRKCNVRSENVAVRLANKGFELRHINELLGHETLTATKRLIDADLVRLGAIVARVI